MFFLLKKHKIVLCTRHALLFLFLGTWCSGRSPENWRSPGPGVLLPPVLQPPAPSESRTREGAQGRGGAARRRGRRQVLSLLFLMRLLQDAGGPVIGGRCGTGGSLAPSARRQGAGGSAGAAAPHKRFGKVDDSVYSTSTPTSTPVCTG